MLRRPNAWLRHWPWLAIPLLALPAFWSYTAGFPASADGFLHLLRTMLLDVSLRQGIFYPRWLPELVVGFGYPVFSFYGPTTYYLAEGLHLLGLGFYQALMGAFVVMVVAGGYGMYLLAQAVLGEQSAPWAPLIAAVAYMYAPYTLVNVFVRGAIGEVGAQALLPWVFWSFNRLLRQPRPARWVLPAALSLGALACTHNITLLFLPPALAVYVVVLWWQGQRGWPRLGWAGLGLFGAMGISAWFWLPVLVERAYLANTAYDVARQFIAVNAWTWTNFLSVTVPYTYNGAVPFQLGLIQLVLAVLGFGLARRWDAEWLFWLGLALVACLGIGAWSLPIWQSNNLLLAAQFPWRLLVLVTLPLALFTGGSLARVSSARWRALGGVGLLVAIIVANEPRFDAATAATIDNSAVDQPAVAQFETLTESVGTSSAQEFMPRWAQFAPLDPASSAPKLAAPPGLKVVAAGPLERVVQVSNPAASTLRFTDFYYPGWHAYLDGQPLDIYPSTNLGLLTVDLPAGSHQVRVVWQGTALEAWAAYVSLAALLLLTGLPWTQRSRWSAGLAAALFVYGAVVTLKPLSPPDPILAPAKPFVQAGLQMLGYRTSRPDLQTLYVYPEWQTNARPTPLRAHWRLTDANGQRVSEVAITPYFGGGHTDNWPANTLVDDAYRLPLPPGTPAGSFDLWLALEPLTTTVGSPPADLAHIATLALAAVPPAQPPAPAQAVNDRFGDSLSLAGYDLRLNQKATAADARPVVRPGDELQYTLYWQALGPVAEDYHGFIHLLNAHQGVLIKRDQLAGSWFRPSVLWDTFSLQPDIYKLRVPADALGGLYWPRVGLYRYETLEHLPVQDATGKSLGSDLDLLPIKVLPPAPPPPAHTVAARFEDVATLLGYQLSEPAGGLHPGSSFTLTLYYHSDSATPTDYTRFIHLSGVDGKLIAQSDAQPQEGVNPTSAWLPGETIVDPVVLTVSPQAAPGTYTLSTGLYDPANGGARLGAFDGGGQSLPDDDVILTPLVIGP